MPYHIERSGSKYKVVSDTGRVMGTHPTKRNAAEQVRALYVNVADAKKEDVIRMGRRRSGVGDSHSGINVSSSGGEGMGISAADQIKELSALVKSLNSEIPSGTPQGTEESKPSGYDGCGCETCKAMNCDCPDCPACSPKNIGDGQNAEFEAAKTEETPTTKSLWGGTIFDLNSFVK